MRYVGIDLGTTNSAIASYDGSEVTLYKSPEQNDVTPSAIYVDKRGNRYIGARAYSNSALDPANSAIIFKRYMGTSTTLDLPNLGKPLTPEECSAEVLRTLYGYLPPQVSDGAETGTIITVPAAFNQMQKGATLDAAELASIGKVALMQEPVAAVMSVMRRRRADGIFLIYDLGGGTLDIAVAQSIAGTVSLLSHGGIPMCGGRDFDRLIVDQIVQPWLQDNFSLPLGMAGAEHKRLQRLASWAAERAKIELSQRDSSVIVLSEAELGVRDQEGRDLFLEVPLSRPAFDTLIDNQLCDSIEEGRRTLERAGLSAADVERVIFIGGPTFYPPLRQKVAFELGIAPSTEVNAMTAVAEGAAIFAESVDWSSANRGRKASRGSLSSVSSSFAFPSRTPAATARVSVQLAGKATPGAEFQIDSLDTGWSSGRLPLRNAAFADLPLTLPGANLFRAKLFDPSGTQSELPENLITITRTAATIDGIPASHSIAVEVRERADGRASLDYLVRQGDLLPKKGTLKFRAAEILRGGEAKSINFRLWEGDIAEPITDNRFIGLFAIRGTDIGDQMVPSGAELICEYEVSDAGNVFLEVQVPIVQMSFPSGKNFYSRQEGQIDFTDARDQLKDECVRLDDRVDSLSSRVPEGELATVSKRIRAADDIAAGAQDPEAAQQASEYLQDAKRLLAEARRRHLADIRELDLESCSRFFHENVRALASPAEADSFDSLGRSAERAIAKVSADFENLLADMRIKTFSILWRQDDFVVARFSWLCDQPHRFVDQALYSQLRERGQKAIERRDMTELRHIVAELDNNHIGSSDDVDLSFVSNIIRT